MWPGFDSRTRHQMWVEFVVGSRPCSERWASCLVSAGRDNFFSYKHFGSPTRGEMAQIVSGARHFVEYVTCLAVLRETSVLEGTAVTTHNSI